MILNSVDNNKFYSQSFTHNFDQGNIAFEKFSTKFTTSITNTTIYINILVNEKTHYSNEKILLKENLLKKEDMLERY